MTWWEILGASLVYAGCGLVCARLVAGHLAWYWNETARVRHKARWPSIHNPGEYIQPNGEQWFGGVLVGVVSGVVWPAVFIGVRLNLGRFAIGAEAEAVRREQRERIDELEREAGIR